MSKKVFTKDCTGCDFMKVKDAQCYCIWGTRTKGKPMENPKGKAVACKLIK